MKKIIIFAVVLIVCMGCSTNISAQNNGADEAIKAATDMLYDVAHQKIERFNWLTVNEIRSQFHSVREKNYKTWEDFYSHLDDYMLPMMKEIFDKGIKIGIDWDDVTVTDVRYKCYYDESWGAEEMSGVIFIMSKGLPFRIGFKRGFALDGKWRTIMLRGMDQSNEIPFDLPLSGRNESPNE